MPKPRRTPVGGVCRPGEVAMNIKKIEATKHGFTEGTGPWSIITLGIKSDNGICLILGEFYYGPGMNLNTDVECQRLEELIDHIILHCGGEEP